MTLEKIMKQLESRGLLGETNDFITKTRKVGVNVADEQLVKVITFMLISKLEPEEDIVTNIIDYAFQNIAEEVVAKYNKEENN